MYINTILCCVFVLGCGCGWLGALALLCLHDCTCTGWLAVDGNGYFCPNCVLHMVWLFIIFCFGYGWIGNCFCDMVMAALVTS